MNLRGGNNKGLLQINTQKHNFCYHKSLKMKYFASVSKICHKTPAHCEKKMPPPFILIPILQLISAKAKSILSLSCMDFLPKIIN